MKCENCNGNGEVEIDNPYYGEVQEGLSPEPMFVYEVCCYCGGTGEVEENE